MKLNSETAELLKENMRILFGSASFPNRNAIISSISRNSNDKVTLINCYLLNDPSSYFSITQNMIFKETFDFEIMKD